MSNLLQNKFSEKEFAEYASSYLPDFRATDSRAEKRHGFSAIKQIGESPSLDLVVFVTTPESSIHARMEISKNSYALLKTHPRAHALIAYHSPDTDEWRLSLITTQVTRSKEGVKETASNPRRFSYVLGPSAKVNTPTKYLISKGKVTDLNDLKERFSLEVVNKDFYQEISRLFTILTGGTFGSGKNKKEYSALLQLPFIPEKDKRSLEFAVRLIGRVIFCWFLREKKSAADVSLMPKELVSLQAVEKQADYYHKVLEPIFFEVLNKQVRSRKEKYAATPFSLIPYLNGGLFSPDYDDYYSSNEDKQASFHNTVIIPDKWLHDFFAFLETYNFTVDENVSFDEELSIDPEMLGRIFENLLAEINPETGESARKSTGSYYTPRVIVDYMVDESLIAYLKEQTAISEESLRALVSYDLEDDATHPLTDEEYGKVLNALSTVKILDPACGSGAFPIGALQKIVFILQQVDPDGRKWFEKQIANTSPEIKRVIEREFANKNFNYIRKLGVIRENIFGVDIQPIATEISRLRCFLTLIVDESIHDELENRGIEPLPNLDFKFVTANTLVTLPIPTGNKQTLFNDRERIDLLRDLRSQFFNSTNSERHQLKLDFKELQNQMLFHMVETRGGDDVTTALSTWDPFSHKMTPWFDPEWMFGVAAFHVVIANPPYVFTRGSDFTAAFKQLVKRSYRTGVGKLNLFSIFIERGMQLLNHGGTLIYIVPNTLFRATSYKPIRQFLVDECRLNLIVDLHAGVFENVTASTTVIEVQNTHEKNESIKVVDSIEELSSNSITSTVSQSSFVNSEYIFGLYSGERDDLFDKIRKNSQALGELCSDIINGIVTPKGKGKYISDRKLGADYKPFLEGKDIESFTIRTKSGKYILFDRDRLHRARPQYVWDADEKIIIRRISGGNRVLFAAYDNDHYYTFASTNLILLKSGVWANIKYVLALLNSKLLNYYYVENFTNRSTLTVNVSKTFLEKLPIKIASEQQQATIVALVEKILAITETSDYLESPGKKASVLNFEKQIDKEIYKLYDLTPAEIKLIEEGVS